MLAADQDLLEVLVLLGRQHVLRPAHHQPGEADDRVERRPELVAHVGEEDALGPGRLLRLLLRRAQRDLGALALDHPPELGADVGHRVEQRPVRLERLAREELEDRDDLVPAQHGKAEAGLEPAPGRGRRAREVGIPGDVGDPGRPAARHAPGRAGRRRGRRPPPRSPRGRWRSARGRRGARRPSGRARRSRPRRGRRRAPRATRCGRRPGPGRSASPPRPWPPRWRRSPPPASARAGPSARGALPRPACAR